MENKHKVKICGIRREEDIQYVNTYEPEYIGFVFAPSKRQVTIAQAKHLRSLLKDTIQVVGVYVNAPIQEIVMAVEEQVIDIVQLHGQEDTTYIETLKQKISAPIIKAIRVEQAEDMENIAYDTDYYLLDGKVAGSGESFNWEWIQKLDKPFFLAGGINEDNIIDALQIPSYGIDISSGVETNGCKDEQKIRKILRSVRNGNR